MLKNALFNSPFSNKILGKTTSPPPPCQKWVLCTHLQNLRIPLLPNGMASNGAVLALVAWFFGIFSKYFEKISNFWIS